ncbi:hypothetical protein LCGC14_1010370 [marine sediment metagenome]|uniref:N-acetyltransferase domain-containing protein n=1 Tax=marine sediment metagenome TaxID=412755 RepID=A0A0F9N0I4_9ZZZZ|nr:N-acetyltransferase [archaeon]
MTEINETPEDIVEEVFPFIEGQSVNLLPINSEHVEIYIKWENNPKVRRYSRNVIPITSEEQKKVIEEAKVDKRIIFEIWHKEDKKPIGFAELNDNDWINRRAEIGLMIGEPEYWNRGLATEAGKLLVNYGFMELNLNKIITSIFSPNIGSWRCVEKIGMIREATLKNHAYIDGVYVDDYKYCIFKEDWLKKRI